MLILSNSMRLNKRTIPINKGFNNGSKQQRQYAHLPVGRWKYHLPISRWEDKNRCTA